MRSMTKAERLQSDLHAAFGYTADNNRDLVGDPSFPMEGVVEELMVEFAYQFLDAYIARNADMINSQMED